MREIRVNEHNTATITGTGFKIEGEIENCIILSGRIRKRWGLPANPYGKDYIIVKNDMIEIFDGEKNYNAGIPEITFYLNSR
jgi:hypothetical protein